MKNTIYLLGLMLIFSCSESSETLYSSLTISSDKSKAFSLPSSFSGFTEGLGVLDLVNKTGKILPLPALDLTKKFRVTYSHSGGRITSGDMIQMQKIKDQLIIYSGSTADFYLYDIPSDSLKLVSFNHQLVENSKSGEFKNTTISSEERWEISKQIRKQITFFDFLCDESRQQYFRFGAKEKGFRETGEPLPTEVFLFSYDRDFNLLGEKKVEELPWPIVNSFFFEGKLYHYWPVGENPGLVEVTLSY